MYIVFEGLDNSGKSTYIELLNNLIKNDPSMPKVVNVVEPGTTEVGKQLRTILKHSVEKIDPITDRLLFMAARNQTLRNEVEPALNEGCVVISDRSYISTYAYQGFEYTTALADMIKVIIPDIVIYMNTPVDVCLARRDGEFDRIETRDMTFYKGVQERYDIVLKQLPDKTSVWHFSGESTDPETIKQNAENMYLSLKRYIEHMGTVTKK